MERHYLVPSAVESAGWINPLERSSLYSGILRIAYVPMVKWEGKPRALCGRTNHCAQAVFSRAPLSASKNIDGESVHSVARHGRTVDTIAAHRIFRCTRRRQSLVSASLGRATETWMEEYIKDDSDSEPIDEMPSSTGQQQKDAQQAGKGGIGDRARTALVVVEGLAVTATGAVLAGQALGFILSPSHKERLAMVSPGKPLPPPPAPLTPWWQVFPLWFALAINFVSRALPALFSRAHGGLGTVRPTSASRLMEERIGRIEEDVTTTIKMVRKLSRQMEKLGIRFRVTRRTLKAPIEETAELAQKTSLATEDLTVRAMRLERELQELQQLLLAMQTQSGRQLELVATLTQAVKTTRQGPVLKLPRHHHRPKSNSRHVAKKEDASQSPREPSSGGEKGVLQKLGDFGRGVFGMSDDEGGGSKAEGRSPSVGGRQGGEERRTAGDSWANLAGKGAMGLTNGKAPGPSALAPLKDESQSSGGDSAAKEKDTGGAATSQSFPEAGGSERTHSLRPKGNGHRSNGSNSGQSTVSANARPPAVTEPPTESNEGSISLPRPQNGPQRAAPMGPQLRPRLGFQGTRTGVDFWAEEKGSQGSAVRREGVQAGAGQAEPRAVHETRGQAVEGEGEDERGSQGEGGGGERGDKAGGHRVVGGDLSISNAGGEGRGKSGEGALGDIEGKVAEERGEARERAEGLADGLEGGDVTVGVANKERDRNGEPARQREDTAK